MHGAQRSKSAAAKPSTQSLYNDTQITLYYAAPNPSSLREKIPLLVNSITTPSL